MMKISKLKRSNLKKAFLYAAIPFVVAAGLSVFSCTKKKTPQAELKTPETEILHFLIDTLFINKKNYDECLAIANYKKATGTITSFWAEVDSTDMSKSQLQTAKKRANSINSRLKKISNLLHENRHKYNHDIYKKIEKKYAELNTTLLTPEHKAELYMHDEISANIEQLLYARDLYLEGMPLDSIPCPSEAYKTFLNKKPRLTKEISPEEIAIFSQKQQEWVTDFREYYSMAHGINIASTIEADKGKKSPSAALSNKISYEILSHYYSFHYHGKFYSIPFERLSLSDVVKSVIIEAKSSSLETSVLDSLRNKYSERGSYTKSGDGVLYASQPLPNYNPNIRSI